jgi:hypothetical protein
MMSICLGSLFKLVIKLKIIYVTSGLSHYERCDQLAGEAASARRQGRMSIGWLKEFTAFYNRKIF